MSERVERCETCRFFDRDGVNDTGRCMRFPPQLNLVARKFYTDNPANDDEAGKCEGERLISQTHSIDVWSWPKVLGFEDWCGEWSAATLPTVWVTDEVASWLGISERAVKKMAARGEIPCRTLPTGGIVFDRAELAEWFADLKNPPTPVDNSPSGVQD